MRYPHLTQHERYQIHILGQAGHDQSEIARLLERSKSTVSRELKRNSGQRGYRPKQAQELSVARMRAADNGRRVSAETWAFAEAKLEQQWSPEQICGYLKVNGMPTVSHESLYRRIYADKRAGGRLHANLRCQKQRKKRYGNRERRGTIPHQVSIELRPAIVEGRTRFGDWEGDLVIGAGRVEMWRGSSRSGIAVAASFVWRCPSNLTITPFPHPAHRTGRADFPHPALGQDFTPSPTPRCALARTGARARSARRGARVDTPRPCVA
jgi:hypothetical protein